MVVNLQYLVGTTPPLSVPSDQIRSQPGPNPALKGEWQVELQLDFQLERHKLVVGTKINMCKYSYMECKVRIVKLFTHLLTY